MILEIKYQEQYSRGELLLRTILGLFYIVIPHSFLLIFVGLASAVLHFLTFWVILFTGRFPESWFEFQVKYMRWQLRYQARIFNIADGYPAFGLDAEDDHVIFEVPYPEKISRSLVLARFFFGFFYVIIPHGIVLALLNMAVSMLSIIAWFAVLFTGKFPRTMFDFIVYFFRWNQRVSLYLNYMTDTYPPFSGEPDQLPEPPTNEAAAETAQAADQEREQKEDPNRFMPPNDPAAESGQIGDGDSSDTTNKPNKSDDPDGDTTPPKAS